MKTLLNTGVFIIYIILVFSCSHKKDDKSPSTKIPANRKTEKNISVTLAGELDFRRSMADAQFMNDEKEIEKYYRRQEKSNPVLAYEQNDSLRKRFEELGIVKGEELLLHKFRYSTKEKFQFDDDSGRKFNVVFKTGIINSFYGIIMVKSGADSCEVKFPYNFPEGLKYAWVDIIPGGNKEIVVLKETYIIMGYNFDLIVYEINKA